METCAVRRVRIPIDEIGAAQELPSTARLNVLIATADGDLRAAADRVLSREGYCVLTAAHSGHAVLACVANSRVDIVVTDLASEEMSGPALADTLRRYHPGLRALYIADTGADAGTPARDGIIVRPLTRDTLLAGLDALCAGATSMPAA